MTLLLDSAWTPVSTVPWQTAVSLSLRSDARVTVVQYYRDWIVRSVKQQYRVPSVLRFTSSASRHNRTVRITRRAIWLRDAGICQYCSKTVGRHEFTLDHVVPRCRGGKTTWSNTVVACRSCNQRKQDRDLESSGMSLIRKPLAPSQWVHQHGVLEPETLSAWLKGPISRDQGFQYDSCIL